MKSLFLLPFFIVFGTLRDFVCIVKTEIRLRRLLRTPYYRVERRIDRYLDALPHLEKR